MASTLAAAMVASMVPYSVLADGPYTNYSSTSVPVAEATVQGKTNIGGSSDSNISNRAVLTKSLVINEDANIPQATFTYAIKSAANSNNYTGNDAKYVVKSNDSNSTVSVYRGINVDKIKAYVYDAGDKATSAELSSTALATDNSKGTKIESSDSTTETDALFKKEATITLVYNKQQVARNAGNTAPSAPDNSSYLITKNATQDDDVYIVDHTDGTNKAAYDYYTANKSMLLDFSGCGFTEPGIYRYIITEAGSNTGITNDGQPIRTLDVYVEHRDAESPSTDNTLKITGYVLYAGQQTGAPKSAEVSGTYSNVSVDGSSDVTANGAEVADAEKSSGWKNTYVTSNLTIGKKVEGNQGSKDKYFKYLIKLTGTANDDVTVQVSGLKAETQKDSNLTEDSSYPNAATKYTNTEIMNGVAADATDGATLVGGNELNDFQVTNGTSLYEVFLKNGQYVTLTGIPKDVKFSIEEVEEDYKQTTYGDINETVSTGLSKLTAYVRNTATGVSAATNVSGATYTDGTEVTADGSNYEYAFLNERAGVIPTGIIMSVAPAVGIVLVGLIAALAVIIGGKKRRDELEEES